MEVSDEIFHISLRNVSERLIEPYTHVFEDTQHPIASRLTHCLLLALPYGLAQFTISEELEDEFLILRDVPLFLLKCFERVEICFSEPVDVPYCIVSNSPARIRTAVLRSRV
jgi:hypothetical protein